jgi:hypothetical protein
MKRLLCLVMGHQRGPVPFSSNRFACRRCGLDLGPTIPAWPLPAATRTQRAVLRGAEDGATATRAPLPRSSLMGRGPYVAGRRGRRIPLTRAFSRR